MKSLLILALVPWSLLAKSYSQAPSIHEGEAFNTLGVMARTPDSPGVWKEIVENRGTGRLVAFHATFDCGKKGGAYYDHDPLYFYGGDLGISPASSIEIEAADPSVCPGGVDAAIFADGHTEGDPVQVEAIFGRRRGIYQAIEMILPLVEDMAAKKKSALQIQESISKLEEVAYNNPRLDAPERHGMRMLFQRIRLTMKTSAGVLITPSDKTARRQPEYHQLAADKSITLEQAQAMVIGNKLREWQADLENHLYPSTAPQQP